MASSLPALTISGPVRPQLCNVLSAHEIDDDEIDDAYFSPNTFPRSVLSNAVPRRPSLPTMRPPSPSPSPDAPTDALPPYSNSIFLIAQMPRKLEFTRPGVLSPDRKWRRVCCVLEGTKFSVYRVPGVKSIFDGLLGAGDAAVHRATLQRSPSTAPEEATVRKVEEETRLVWEQEMRQTTTFLSPTPLPRSPASSSSSSSSDSWSSHLSRATSITSLASRTRPSHCAPAPPQRPDPALLLREYTLQNAESGLGSDYTKRRNVIRVRMEGEQFLLQAKDMDALVQWIEGFQAASDIALDLDERKMPRGPLFPRRRRRRPRPAAP